MPLTDVRTIVRLTKIVVQGSSVTQAQISAFSAVVMMRNTTKPNNTPDVATLIPLTPPDADGVQFGSLDGRVLCDNDADIYRVNVGPGKRLRVTLTYDLVGAPGFTLEGDSGSCQDSGDCANLIEWVCDADARTCVSPLRTVSPTGLEAIMEYPPLPGQNTGGADVVNDNASYYITVEPTIDTRFQYRIDVAVADATASCFPDARELGAGDDIRSNGTEIPVLGLRSEYSVTGTSCGNDTDWFKINLNPNDGLHRPSKGCRRRPGPFLDCCQSECRFTIGFYGRPQQSALAEAPMATLSTRR